MKTIRIALIIFSMLAVFACNNQQSKKAEEDTTVIRKPISKKTIIKKTDIIEQKEIKLCEDLITEIVTTSPRYRQLTKGLYKAVVNNGGQSFGIRLEGSPSPGQGKTKNYSKTYDFTLYEMYPDRQLNTARFSYNPNKKQLYEYDEINTQLNPIEFDSNLLLKYEALCK
jgi:hypothetical protein